ncbi:hypothetical protein CC1G_12184 [Coprinopsis cinerea okayama7|uniref:Uncharacterized protein n=1 Tax=Coprinopsis cinerea (strain Okayama-7 / 130 / ATCC MYA-4618 / FGSC 9003) TaxID=240176 RepID=A8N0X4_COPC7|nr:hypothetical protein CC1G_12184 [Coprinopsis cinerea okayama7\|eukprot:XP_001828523.2 hypothetical protein CC1G_12184 [Coprinopsis cinerea okayama7\
MSSASARAEARRRAILSRGSDRLAKLTTSARGEDAPRYMSESTGIRSTSRTFLGEDTADMPVPKPLTPDESQASSSAPSASRSTTSTTTATNPVEAAAGLGLGRLPTPDPSVWSPEQQQQFMRALMGAAAMPPQGQGTGQTPLQSPLGDPNAPIDPSLPPMDNPLAAMLFPQGPGFNPSKSPVQEAAPPQPPSKFQRLMPLVHLLAMWCLLAYFIFYFEPKAYVEQAGFVDGANQWSRWANLIRTSPTAATITKVFKVQLVPFFWAFLTLEVMLHSLRIFSKSDKIQPPTLLALALPHIPAPFPSIIINSLKYWRMLSLFLDDIAGLVVGLGFIIYFAGFLS